MASPAATSPQADAPVRVVAALGVALVGIAVGGSASSAVVGGTLGPAVGEKVSPRTVGARDEGADVGTKRGGLSVPWRTRDHDWTATDATESVEVSKVQTPTGTSSQNSKLMNVQVSVELELSSCLYGKRLDRVPDGDTILNWIPPRTCISATTWTCTCSSFCIGASAARTATTDSTGPALGPTETGSPAKRAVRRGWTNVQFIARSTIARASIRPNPYLALTGRHNTVTA